jgi:hypothetical protein
MTGPSMHKSYSTKKLYGLAYQWIEDKQHRGMDESEANKLAPVILDFFEFVMKQKPKKARKASLKS